MILEVHAIDTFYGETQALYSVSLSVANGEVLALLGANGAGKTTTLRSILGLTRPRRGSIRFSGRTLRFRPPMLSPARESAGYPMTGDCARP